MNLLDVTTSMMESKISDFRIAHAKEHKCLILELPTLQSSTDLIIFLPYNSSLAKIEEVFGKNPDEKGRKAVPKAYIPSNEVANIDKMISQLRSTPKTKNVKIFIPRWVLEFSYFNKIRIKI